MKQLTLIKYAAITMLGCMLFNVAISFSDDFKDDKVTLILGQLLIGVIASCFMTEKLRQPEK